jgi:mono/diheme cytochrome c family protein
MLLAVCVAVVAAESHAPESGRDDPAAAVARILSSSCTRCHGAGNAAAGVDLTPEGFSDALIDVPSGQVEGFKLVDTKVPERSYLLMKVRGASGIDGSRMPLGGGRLDDQAIQTIEAWVAGLSTVSDPVVSEAPPPEASGGRPLVEMPTHDRGGQNDRDGGSDTGATVNPAFSTTRVVNLPTTVAIGAGDVLFRVSHRMLPPVSSGYEDFFGVNGPAYIMLALGYGITEDLSVTVGHTNLFHEFELVVAWDAVDQGASPVSASLVAGVNLVTLETPGQDVFRSENVKLHVALPIARRLTDRFSILAVLAYATNTNHWESSSDGTFGVGLAGRARIAGGLSLIGEWTAVAEGYEAEFDAWGVGLDYEIGGHVFQVFGTNAVGLTTDQFIPGGFPELGTSDMRLGFNIFRTF